MSGHKRIILSVVLISLSGAWPQNAGTGSPDSGANREAAPAEKQTANDQPVEQNLPSGNSEKNEIVKPEGQAPELDKKGEAPAPQTVVKRKASKFVSDYTPAGRTKAPSFVQNGGNIQKNEHAFLLYLDASTYPPPIMAGYRHGLMYWWDIGFDVGGNAGTFQFIMHMRQENFKTKNEFFYWGINYKTGYKYNKYTFTNTLKFDDKSWVLHLENSFAFRFGKKSRNKALYLNTLFYFDFDLHRPRRQTDIYIAPLMLGFEGMVNNFLNLFVEAGLMLSLNGMEFAAGEILYKRDLFPVIKFGVAFRTGDRTAIWYHRETKDKAARRENISKRRNAAAAHEAEKK